MNEACAVSQPDAPKIEFPCPNYPVKILGKGAEDYVEAVCEIVRRHDPELSLERMQVRDSRNGSFRSVTLYITATGVDQLQALHQDLSAHPYVQMVI